MITKNKIKAKKSAIVPFFSKRIKIKFINVNVAPVTDDDKTRFDTIVLIKPPYAKTEKPAIK